MLIFVYWKMVALIFAFLTAENRPANGFRKTLAVIISQKNTNFLCNKNWKKRRKQTLSWLDWSKFTLDRAPGNSTLNLPTEHNNFILRNYEFYLQNFLCSETMFSECKGLPGFWSSFRLLQREPWLLNYFKVSTSCLWLISAPIRS